MKIPYRRLSAITLEGATIISFTLAPFEYPTDYSQFFEYARNEPEIEQLDTTAMRGILGTGFVDAHVRLSNTTLAAEHRSLFDT